MPRSRTSRYIPNDEYRSAKGNTTPASNAAGSISNILDKNIEEETKASSRLQSSSSYLTRKVNREAGRQNLSSLKRIFDKNPSTMEAERHRLVLRSVKTTFQKMSNMELYETAKLYGVDYEDFPKGSKGKEELVEALVGEYLIRMDSREKADLYKKVITAEREIEMQGKKLSTAIDRATSSTMSENKVKNYGKVSYRKSISIQNKMSKTGLDSTYKVTYNRKFKPFYKELFSYLKSFNNQTYLLTLATGLDLTFSDRVKTNVIRRRIAETVMVYADMISTKKRRSHAVTKSEEFKKIAKDLLQYTSISFISIPNSNDIVIDRGMLKVKTMSTPSREVMSSNRKNVRGYNDRIRNIRKNKRKFSDDPFTEGLRFGSFRQGRSKERVKSRRIRTAKGVGLAGLGLGSAGLAASLLSGGGINPLLGAYSAGYGLSGALGNAVGLGGLGAAGGLLPLLLGGAAVGGVGSLISKRRSIGKLRKSKEYKEVKGFLEGMDNYEIFKLADRLGIRYNRHTSMDKIKDLIYRGYAKTKQTVGKGKRLFESKKAFAERKKKTEDILNSIKGNRGGSTISSSGMPIMNPLDVNPSRIKHAVPVYMTNSIAKESTDETSDDPIVTSNLGILHMLATYFGVGKNYITGMFSNAKAKTKKRLNRIKNRISGGFNKIKNTLGNIKDKGKNIVGKVADKFSSMREKRLRRLYDREESENSARTNVGSREYKGKDLRRWSKDNLYNLARSFEIPGYSKMNKRELQDAIYSHFKNRSNKERPMYGGYSNSLTGVYFKNPSKQVRDGSKLTKAGDKLKAFLNNKKQKQTEVDTNPTSIRNLSNVIRSGRIPDMNATPVFVMNDILKDRGAAAYFEKDIAEDKMRDKDGLTKSEKKGLISKSKAMMLGIGGAAMTAGAGLLNPNMMKSGFNLVKKFGGKFISKSGLQAVGKLATKAAPWAAAAAGVYGGVKGAMKTKDMFGEDANFGNYVSSSLGGAINTLTFGLVKTEGAAKFIDQGVQKIGDLGKAYLDGWKKIGSATVNFIKNPKKAFNDGIKSAAKLANKAKGSLKQFNPFSKKGRDNLKKGIAKASKKVSDNPVFKALSWANPIGAAINISKNKDKIAEGVTSLWDKAKGLGGKAGSAIKKFGPAAAATAAGVGGALLAGNMGIKLLKGFNNRVKDEAATPTIVGNKIELGNATIKAIGGGSGAGMLGDLAGAKGAKSGGIMGALTKFMKGKGGKATLATLATGAVAMGGYNLWKNNKSQVNSISSNQEYSEVSMGTMSVEKKLDQMIQLLSTANIQREENKENLKMLAEIGEESSNAVVRKTRDIIPNSNFFGTNANSATGYNSRIAGLAQGV
jgi:hypothetical protein